MGWSKAIVHTNTIFVFMAPLTIPRETERHVMCAYFNIEFQAYVVIIKTW